MNYLHKKRFALMMNKKFRGYLRTVSGYPLTLTDCIEDNAVSFKISGADGGVGDKTANLFDISASEGFTSQYGNLTNKVEGNVLTVTCSTSSRGGYLTLGTFAAGTYYIGIETIQFTGTAISVYADGSRIGAANSVLTLSKESKLQLYCAFNSGTSQFKNIQVAKSNVATKYESYGYKIPITVAGKDESYTVNAYTNMAINESETREMDIVLPLYKGTNTITVGTTVQPANMEVSYYADREE